MMNTEDKRKIEDTELEQVSGGTGEGFPKEINGLKVVSFEARRTCPNCGYYNEELEHTNGSGEFYPEYGYKRIVLCDNDSCRKEYVYFQWM